MSARAPEPTPPAGPRPPEGAARLAALAVGPLLAVQGALLLRRLPRLGEAGGPAHGLAPAGAGPGPGTDPTPTQAPAQAQAAPASRAAAPLRLVVTGESTAVGVGVERHEEGMAGALARALAAGTGRDVAWRAAGRNGARARADAWRRLPALEEHHDVVVLVLGVNDTLGLTSVGRWRAELALLVRQAHAHTRPGGLVVLAGVPRIDAFPALPQPMRAVLGAHARDLDRALARLAADAPATVHVPTPPMEDDRDLSPDGFHPSAHGYARWAAHLHERALAGRAWAGAAPDG